MSPMSERRETTLNASLLRLVAEHEARRLPLAEVLAHRRHHHDDGRERVGRRRLPGARRGVELAGVERECVRRRLEDGRVGERLAELDLAVAVEIRLDALRGVLGTRAPEHALGEVEEVARACAGRGRRRASGRTAPRSPDPPSRSSPRRGSRRRPRATACRRRRLRRARSTGCPRSRASSSGRRMGVIAERSRLPQRRVVEVRRPSRARSSGSPAPRTAS